MTSKPISKKRILVITAIALACVLAIAGIVTTSVLLGTREVPVDNPKIEQPDPGKDPGTTPDPDDNKDPEPGPTVTEQSMGLPLENCVVDMAFANSELLYSPTLELWQTHLGTDFKAEKGTNVLAVLDGVVEKAEADPLYGTYVTIRHDKNRISVYKSLDPALKVKVGDTVKKGDVIGAVGDTMISEAKQGSHLHFELTVDGKLVNCADYMSELGGK